MRFSRLWWLGRPDDRRVLRAFTRAERAYNAYDTCQYDKTVFIRCTILRTPALVSYRYHRQHRPISLQCYILYGVERSVQQKRADLEKDLFRSSFELFSVYELVRGSTDALRWDADFVLGSPEYPSTSEGSAPRTRSGRSQRSLRPASKYLGLCPVPLGS